MGFSMSDEKPSECIHPKCLVETQDKVEKEVFGEHTVRLRNLGGLVASITVCITALINSGVIYLSVRDHNVWPSETSMFIMVVGPVLIAWSWMSVNQTLKTLFNGASSMTRFRSRVADIISPKAPTDQQDRQH